MIDYIFKLLNFNDIEILSSTDFLIKILFLAILTGAILMVTAESILLSCFSLIFIFICGMGVSICLNLWFIGLLILIIYIGAIATLFLFIILMIDLYTKIEQENNIEKYITIFMNLTLIFLIFCVNYDYIFAHDEITNTGVKTYEEFFQLEEKKSTNAQVLHLFKEEDIIFNEKSVYVNAKNEITRQQKLTANIVSLDGNDISVLGTLLYTHFAIILILCGSSLLIAIIGVLITAEGLAKWDFITNKNEMVSITHVNERKQDSFQQILKLYRLPMKNQDNNKAKEQINKTTWIKTAKNWFRSKMNKIESKKEQIYLAIPTTIFYNWNTSSTSHEDKITVNLFIVLLFLLFLSVLIILSIDFERGTARLTATDESILNLTAINGDILVAESNKSTIIYANKAQHDRRLMLKQFMPFFIGLKRGIFYNTNNSLSYKLKILILASIVLMCSLCGFFSSFGGLVMYGTVYYVPLEFVFNFRNIAIAFFIWIWAICFFVFTIKSQNYIKKSELLLFWIILWTMLLAMCSNDILSLIILLESITFCLYILASLQDSNWDNTKKQLASVYYARFGLLASCLFIFGCALLYLSLGQWKLSEIALQITSVYEVSSNFNIKQLCWDNHMSQNQYTREVSMGEITQNKAEEAIDKFREVHVKWMGTTPTNIATQLGLIFILLSFLFKFSLVPVHLWIVMVYENIRFDVLGFFVVFTKQVFFFIFIEKFYSSVMNEYIPQEITIYVSLLSVLVGIGGALFNNSIKNFIAFSSIASSGIIMLCLGYYKIDLAIVGLLYFLLYTIFVFLLLMNFRFLSKNRNSEALEKFSDLKNKQETDPFITVIGKILVFALTGIPIFVLFLAKIFIYIKLLINYNIGVFIFIFLAFAAMVGYYLKIILMNMDLVEPLDKKSSIVSSAYELKNLATKYSLEVVLLNVIILILIICTPFFVDIYSIVFNVVCSLVN